MQGNADILTLSLAKPVSTEALRTLRADTAGAIDAGNTLVALDVDDVGILDSQVISTLIAILRDARARGAGIELRARRKNILDTLRITGLDQVFAVSEPVGAAPPKAVPVRLRAPARRGRLVASVATGAFAAASLLGAHDAPRPLKVAHVKTATAGTTQEERR